MTDIEHATALIRAFLSAERQGRYLALLGSSRGRSKLRARLAHLHDLDQRYARPIPPASQTATEIAKLLRAHGALATCVLLAEDKTLDGRELPLDAAVSAVVGRGMGAFVSCLPGRLAYYEGEAPGERYLLERPAFTAGTVAACVARAL